MVITDSQVHLWRAETPERPWPADSGHTAQREEPLEPGEMLGLMDGAGVARAVIVPPIWIGDDNRDGLRWAHEHPDRFAVMGRFDLWDPDRGRLAHWLDDPAMLGIRMSYSPHRGFDWLQVDTFPWFWEAAQRHEIPIMLLVQGRAAAVAPIAEAYPDLKLIVDHLGLQAASLAEARRGAVGRLESIEEMIALAKYPNVYGKVSSLAIYAGEPYPFPRLYDLLARTVEAFGPERLMWGSDISRLSGLTFGVSYQETLDHVRHALDFLDGNDREWILSRTAATALRWPTGPLSPASVEAGR